MPDQLITDLLDAIHRLGRAQHGLPMGGLPKAEFFTLAMVGRYQHEHPDSRGMYVSELVRHMRCAPPAVSRTLRHLDEKGLLARVVDPDDRRTTYAVVTPAGQDFLAANWEQLTALSRRVVRRMGEEHLHALIAQLDRLTDIILEEEQKEETSC